jgi:hypothetical protein
MVMASVSVRDDYWQTFEIEQEDIDFLYQYLLEVETPLTPAELTSALVEDRIRREIEQLDAQRSAGGEIFLPKETYKSGQALIFPAFGWQKGVVKSIRPGVNPDVPPFEVITVEFEGGETRQVAAGIADHMLNNPPEIFFDADVLRKEFVLDHFSEGIQQVIENSLESNDDFVRIAGKWFPVALLIDVNLGHLNLAEAVLDMEGGGPLSTSKILEQVEMSNNENTKLVEFSFDYALEKDPRFDEVGPSGEVQWFLRRLEPEEVRDAPIFLRYTAKEYDRSVLTPEMLALERQLDDELSLEIQSSDQKYVADEVEVRLIFPHLQAGTLPLSSSVLPIFPTAYEAPRVRFMLKDGDTGENFPGWVVREPRYVFGLKEWYFERGLGPGSLIRVSRGSKPGEVFVRAGERRSSRDWMRTALVGTDGGIVFAMLRQIVQADYDERMAIAIPDIEALEKLWHRPEKQQPPLERVVVDMVRELTKLNPQGHVHASELYAAVNLVKRCPPGPILSLLASRPWFVHVGDLHFRFDDSEHS